jgi:hypothetical protein
MNANTAEFSDQVRMVSDTYTITADILTIHFKPQAEGQSRMQSAVSGKDISRMVARGSVIIRTESLTASSDVAEYEPDAGRVTLSGGGAASPRAPAAAKPSGGAPLVQAGRPPQPDQSRAVRVLVLPSPGSAKASRAGSPASPVNPANRVNIASRAEVFGRAKRQTRPRSLTCNRVASCSWSGKSPDSYQDLTLAGIYRNPNVAFQTTMNHRLGLTKISGQRTVTWRL